MNNYKRTSVDLLVQIINLNAKVKKQENKTVTEKIFV